jgi:alpha-amylase
MFSPDTNGAINREDTVLNRTFQTHLPAGTYCDIISGDFSGLSPKGSCSGRTIKVITSANKYMKLYKIVL